MLGRSLQYRASTSTATERLPKGLRKGWCGGGDRGRVRNVLRPGFIYTGRDGGVVQNRMTPQTKHDVALLFHTPSVHEPLGDFGIPPGITLPPSPMTATSEELRYGAGARQTLDLYTVEGDTAKRLIVFVHGGAWRT